MANFSTHLAGGFAVSAVTALIGYKAGLISDNQLILCTLIGTAGGLLPDIDSDNSTPIKIGFSLLSLIVAFALVIYWRSTFSLAMMIGVWIGGFLTMRYAIFELFTRITVHRGVIHSVPYMAIMALGLVSICYYLLGVSAVSSWFYGIFLFVGSMVHLLLDEMYSVNLLGMKIKRSFGTALKFYQQEDALLYLIIYAVLSTMLYFAPPIHEFNARLTDPITWELLKQALL